MQQACRLRFLIRAGLDDVDCLIEDDTRVVTSARTGPRPKARWAEARGQAAGSTRGDHSDGQAGVTSPAEASWVAAHARGVNRPGSFRMSPSLERSTDTR